MTAIAPAAWVSRPPSACRPIVAQVQLASRPGSTRTFSSSRHRLKLWWQPLPITPVAGLGMKLAVDAELAGDLLADLRGR